MAETSPELSGLLYKRRGGFGKIMPNAWQYRFFALSREGILQYFDTEIPDTDSLDSRARGRLDLRSINFEISLELIEGAPTQFSIQILVPNEETWKMSALTKEDQARWVKALEKYQTEKLTKVANLNSMNPSSDEDLERSKKQQRPNSPRTGLEESFARSAEIPKPEPVSVLTATDHNEIPQSNSNNKDSTMNVKENRFVSRRNSNRKRLKLASAKGFIDQESGELFLVLVILNFTFIGVFTSGSFLTVLFYIVASNVVVFHTLSLRSKRSKNVISDSMQVKSMHNLPDSVTKDSVSSHTTEQSRAEEVSSESAIVKAITSDEKPVPGFTYSRVDSDPRRAPPHTWSTVDHRLFNVRIGPNYDRYKKKAPSNASIYEPFAVDVFCTKSRVDHVARRFNLPDTTSLEVPNSSVPPIFIVQIQIPSEPPPSFFTTTEDGPGWAVVMYFKLTEDSRTQLSNMSQASPAIKLFSQWCEKADKDPAWRGRFKVINSCTNLSEIGVPSAIEAYNAKPVLIRRTGSIFKGPNYMEMDIHVHKFANLAKQSIYLLSSRCSQLYMQIGFVIEGRDDSELPESLFACVAINRPQEDQAEFIFED